MSGLKSAINEKQNQWFVKDKKRLTPVPGNVVKRVVLEHKVNNMLDVTSERIPGSTSACSAVAKLSDNVLVGQSRCRRGKCCHSKGSRGLHLGLT